MIENFSFLEERKNMLMQYCSFSMRVSNEKVTTEWQKLEEDIAAGCTTSLLLFILVMEMILR